MQHDIRSIEALLARHGFRFSKSMGQNFLIDESIPRAIAEASGADAHHGVLEVGPGIGALSCRLCERAGRVTAVELDKRLPDILAETMANYHNFTLVSGDVLQLDLAALAREHFAGLTPIVCANLPYNITTPALTAFLRAGCFESITVLIQREVARRLCAAPGTAGYGAFTVFMQYYTDPRIVFDVPPECFCPAPKVTSSVLHAPVRSAPPVKVKDEAFFFRVVNASFALRRKTLLNSLMTSFGTLGREGIGAAIEAAGLSPSVRGEALNMEEFAALASALEGMSTS